MTTYQRTLGTKKPPFRKAELNPEGKCRGIKRKLQKSKIHSRYFKNKVWLEKQKGIREKQKDIFKKEKTYE